MPDLSPPAFPAEGSALYYGMSQRELMAMMIASGIASKFGDFALSGRSDLIADASVNIADALLERLKS